MHPQRSLFWKPMGAALALAVCSSCALAADTHDWTLIRGDAAMTGVSSQSFSFPLKQKWTALVGDKTKRQGIVGTAVTYGGKVYVGAQNGVFACLNEADGKILWKVEKKDQFFEGSAAFAGGLVIAGCGDGWVYAWNMGTGAEVWKFETQGEIHAGANIWTDETGKPRVLIGSYDNNLYCLDALTGAKIWNFETTNYVNGASAVYQNQVVFGGCDGMLYVLDVKTGKEIKQIEVGNYIGNNIAAADGNAYLDHYGNKVEAYSFSTGAKLWEFNERDFPYYAAPAVKDNWVIAGGRDKRVHALDRKSGQQKWQFRTRGDVDSSPVITGDGHVLFGSNDGNFYAVELESGSETWHYEIGAPVKSAPAVANGCILVGADDGVLYCFESGGSNAANAPK